MANKLSAKQRRDIYVQVMRFQLEHGKKSSYGLDCGAVICGLIGIFRDDWPEMAGVLDELHQFARETERKRGWL